MRAQYEQVMPGATKAMVAVVREVRHSSLEPGLVELVKIRASQVNGCAYCVDTHIRAAYADLVRAFSEEEIVALTHAIISINGFNRLAIAFRQPVDEPRPTVRAAAR